MSRTLSPFARRPGLLRARHEAAERNLYPGAIAMLQQVQAAHPDVIIGAVTNGRGDPLDMRDTLRPYFDFTISGEDDEGYLPGLYGDIAPVADSSEHEWVLYCISKEDGKIRELFEWRGGSWLQLG